ncbi:MAG: glucose-1-phosphate thymidylyltransferase, partial [bacterium]|nr:glucose-1-phosphate thymidylyltransferase [bacterium]
KAGTTISGPCFIGDNCEIGPSNVLRGPLSIEQGVKTGAFCEIKHSIVQEGTHFHSGYVGDSIIGRNCRFGAGFATANRRLDRNTIEAQVKDKKVDTKLSSLGVVVGDGTHFGIHTGTMPGVFVGSECRVYPGTLVFENIADGMTLSAKVQTTTKGS